MGGSTMRKGYIRRNDSYDIPYRCEGNIDDEKLVLAVHGFASSKESPTVEMADGCAPGKGDRRSGVRFSGAWREPG